MQSGISKTDQVILVAADDVASTKADLQSTVAALRNKLEGLTGQWEGRGHLAFQGVIQAWQSTADRVLTALDTFDAELRSSEAAYDDSDDHVATTLNRYHSALAG